eukprot:CAMPEP_0201518644 /NCGR_PEP_ID=MMETSP0161_2-20130828/9433_1 /ASSEMBLY_ACC=CAM_ASM_000251 /TAXON_ID=180227 /ORGANISM="Neoparamoeba aestuarina, Strain SoJaBio B1-5/56/2" /LENGTH=351 /DNA_ID=CAMNT_0047916473 /DNA_START=76 /DNA_END=1131 /DNA_ORIENTATION=+
MFSAVRKHIPSAPSEKSPYFLTDTQLRQLIEVKYDIVCSMDVDQAKARMVEIAKVYAKNVHSISMASTSGLILTEDGCFSPLASAITPLIGCVSESGLQIIHYDAKKCLKSPVMSKEQALRITTDIVDFLPSRSFLVLADMSNIPSIAWIRGKFATIGAIWSHVLNVLCHEWVCNVGRVICYHVSFTTQAYLSAKIDEPALETVKFAKLTQTLKNMGPRCIERLEIYLSDMTIARRAWENHIMKTKRTNAFAPSAQPQKTTKSGLEPPCSIKPTSFFPPKQDVAEDDFEGSAYVEPPVLANTEVPPHQSYPLQPSKPYDLPEKTMPTAELSQKKDIQGNTNDMSDGDEIMT